MPKSFTHETALELMKIAIMNGKDHPSIKEGFEKDPVIYTQKLYEHFLRVVRSNIKVED